MEFGVVESFFLIFSGAALLATLALYTRQPLLVAYIGIGMLLGPHALGWIPDAAFVEDIGEIGIIFLLFLLGLDLPPNKLRTMLGASVVTALGSTAVFFAVGFGVMAAFGFALSEALVGGIAAVFSSTIIGIKLLPTTVLHHRHVGEIVISLLLIQDLLAIAALLALAGYDPAAAVSLWRKMEREGGARLPRFLSTHPSPGNRRETLAALGRQMQALRPAVPPRPRPVEILP